MSDHINVISRMACLVGSLGLVATFAMEIGGRVKVKSFEIINSSI